MMEFIVGNYSVLESGSGLGSPVILFKIVSTIEVFSHWFYKIALFKGTLMQI